MQYRKDFYTRKAISEGYLARSVYKIKDIDKKYRIMKKSDVVLDLGCFPGGWVQYCLQVVGNNGFVVGVDEKEVKLMHNCFLFYNMDVFDDAVLEIDKKFDVVLSDLAPRTTGMKELDKYRSFDLAFRALGVAKKKLKSNGNFIAKIFQGSDFIRFLDECRKCFNFVKCDKPKASKRKSVEMYIVCKNFKDQGI